MKALSWRVGTSLILTALVANAATAEEPKVSELVTGPESSAPEETVEQVPPPAPAPGPADEFDRGVPRTSVAGFLAAAEDGDWERAVEYIDTRRMPRGFSADEASELARQLAFLLDRFVWIHPETLSADPEGHSDDRLPSYQDYIGRIEAPERQVDVLLQRVPRGDGV